MGPTPRIQVCFPLLLFVQILAIAAETDNQDFVALTALKDMWQNSTPPTWVGSDPCGNGWDGIKCTKSRVTAITLPSMGLTGQLSGGIEGLSELQSLIMEKTQLQGKVPEALFSLPNLQTVVLRNNQLNGTLDIGTSRSNYLQLIDLQANFIDDYRETESLNIELILVGNPVCEETNVPEKYCKVSQTNLIYSTHQNNCMPVLCSSGQISSPNCKCACPYSGTLVFRAPSFSDLQNTSRYTSLEHSLMLSFQTHYLPVDSVSLSNLRKDSVNYLELRLEVFPYGQYYFNRSGILNIGFVMSNQTFKPPKYFGPFYFLADEYRNFAGKYIFHIISVKFITMSAHSHHDASMYFTSNEDKLVAIFVLSHCDASFSLSVSLFRRIYDIKQVINIGIIIGAAAGGSVLVLLLLLAVVYAFCQKRRAERATENNPFASWDPNKSSGSIPQLKGARCFSFEVLNKCTDKFSEASELGSGGYGKFYKGTLSSGELVAIKRAQQGSTHGGLEFKTEIELLSRVHHKNVVSLVGFCFDQGEQMLVYEYVPNGTLKDSLSGKSGIRMDWTRRLKVSLRTARGLSYLHELANPPIIHRDIKSNNILLDERLNAKVADFGLSKPMGNSEKGHGYVDPEYYMTRQLTEKSDVYSFGVLMLELVTGRRPIERGKYIVREVRIAMDKTKDLYNLHEFLDPAIGLGTTLKGLERYMDLAMRCVEEAGADRPTMGEVVKQIENIMQLAGLNSNAESASTSASYEGESRGNFRHPYGSEASDTSGHFSSSKTEPY
ncbi:hypothetical protein L1049_015298 [Liquidambar formosana]|uniref:non-specific serine/threonine protein kinase n=1 Tax=Liquidambar formosana TaxID=63359 RepID=A0AAP0S3G8_LIQFO